MTKPLHASPGFAPAALATALFLTAAAPAAAQQPAAAGPAALPAPESLATDRLNHSPRHGEWVKLDAGGGDSVRTWVVYPERHDKAPVVVVIHEIFGLTDWVRGVADQLAAAGFIAIAPDLLSGKGPNGGGTESVDRQGATALIRTVTPAEVNRRLDAAARYGRSLPAATGAVGTVGFCWGGGVSFQQALNLEGIRGAVVYYGVSPDTALLSGVRAPILGLYAGEDARVGATVPPAQAVMQRLGKRFEVATFEGAGHGFLRALAGQNGANQRAAEQAWPRTIAFFQETLGR
ncbi:MAG: dienelactone hydrolase family protein [Gemmatimonadales bacterium]